LNVTNRQRALVLLRWAGRPVGQLLLPVRDGHIPKAVIEEHLASTATWDFWAAWLHDSLGWDEAETRHPLPPATIAVCTRNRPDDLRRCLDGIAALPDDGQEVIVVDNNSPDSATLDVVAAFPRARYVSQKTGGLDAARNRAIHEARHDIVAFTDDDAFVDRNWLRALVRNFENPLVLCATGLTMPVELETEAQELFESYTPFCRGFTRRVFDGNEMNPLAVGQVGAGANLAFRRSLPDLVGPFDEALDGGTATKSGGDHEMFSRILAAGYQIVYDPAALNWHRHRRTWNELRDTLRGYGTGVYAMWTRALLKNREFSVFKHAFAWLSQGQVPELIRSLRPGTRRLPAKLLLAELRGCLSGPRAYIASRQALRRRT
jgi:glycosyltransferase involved in cell wall biosynthesis